MQIIRRDLGKNGPQVPAIGLGCMVLSGSYGPANEKESLSTLDRALELGCNFWDTADVYAHGQNEQLVSRALKGRRNQVVLATKCGFVWTEGKEEMRIDGSRQHIHAACDASLQRLGVEVIDLYYLHRLDPSVPIEESIGAMADLVRSGKVRHIGLSEVSANTLRRAARVHPIAALQSEYSLWTRDPEGDIFQACRELGVCFVAFSPVGRGFLVGGISEPKFPANDFRWNVPRLVGDNFQRNLLLVEKIRHLAEEKRCTPAQLALAWVIAQSDFIFAIPGTRRRDHLEDNWAAQQVRLTPADLAHIRENLPESAIAGERYNPAVMARVDRS
ncbi:MAG TPA: aldo/keto reductase [Terriglobales bacterium]|nr:aldo/keto reductase [Terriglobales bacterium]